MEKIKTFAEDARDLSWEVSEIVGHYHVTCHHSDLRMAGSGFSMNRETAKKIAFAEANERYIVTQLKQSLPSKTDWALNFDDSCSGFAVGFSKEKSVLRSVCEATERWALSKWIDDKFDLPKNVNPVLSKVAKDVLKHFSDYSIYSIEIPSLVDGHLVKVNIVVALCWTDRGVYAGYGAKLGFSESLEHAFVEALRNFVIHKNQITKTSFPFDRIHFFAENKNAALESIAGCKSSGWPVPKLKMLKVEQFDGLWLARSIFDGWKPWQQGPVTRFLY